MGIQNLNRVHLVNWKKFEPAEILDGTTKDCGVIFSQFASQWVIYIHQYMQPASWRRIQLAEQVFRVLTYWFTDFITPTVLSFQPAERRFSLRYLHPAEWTVLQSAEMNFSLRYLHLAEWTVLQPPEGVFSWRYLHPAESIVLQPAQKGFQLKIPSSSWMNSSLASWKGFQLKIPSSSWMNNSESVLQPAERVFS